MTERVAAATDEPPAPAGGSFAWRRVAFGLVVAVLVAGFAVTRPAGDLLHPDLGFAVPEQIYTGVTEDGVPKLFLSAMIVNVGDGPLLIDAGFDRSRNVWEVSQRIARSIRGSEPLDVIAEVRYGGDGHDHLHIEGAALYTLSPLGDDSVVAVDEKVGFCFFDQNRFRTDLSGAPAEPVFPAADCGGSVATAFDMGLSVGYGDNYTWNLPGQSLPLTGLADGDYLLTLTADPGGLFSETDETNNTAWAEIRIDGLERNEPSVDILTTGSDL